MCWTWEQFRENFKLFGNVPFLCLKTTLIPFPCETLALLKFSEQRVHKSPKHTKYIYACICMCIVYNLHFYLLSIKLNLPEFRWNHYFRNVKLICGLPTNFMTSIENVRIKAGYGIESGTAKKSLRKFPPLWILFWFYRAPISFAATHNEAKKSSVQMQL